jgi:hypothetical protein
MRLTCRGTDVTRHRDGTMTVRAQIVDERTEQVTPVLVTGSSLEDCRQQLQALTDAAHATYADEALRIAVVGQVLAQSGEQP